MIQGYSTYQEARAAAIGVIVSQEAQHASIIYSPGARGETRERPYYVEDDVAFVRVWERLIGTLTNPASDLFVQPLEVQLVELDNNAQRLAEFLTRTRPAR